MVESSLESKVHEYEETTAASTGLQGQGGLQGRKRTADGCPDRPDLVAENRTLKAELQRVREQRDILKKTPGILSEAPKIATSASPR